jgi:hypothetical protein
VLLCCCVPGVLVSLLTRHAASPEDAAAAVAASAQQLTHHQGGGGAASSGSRAESGAAPQDAGSASGVLGGMPAAAFLMRSDWNAVSGLWDVCYYLRVPLVPHPCCFIDAPRHVWNPLMSTCATMHSALLRLGVLHSRSFSYAPEGMSPVSAVAWLMMPVLLWHMLCTIHAQPQVQVQVQVQAVRN